MPLPAGGVFVGRQQELLLLDDLRAGLASQGAALIVEGAPGVGKTALVEQFERSIPPLELRTVRASGMAAESSAPYSALHLVLQPFLDRVPHLPPPQRDALRTAFGLRHGPPPTPFLASLAALTLVSEEAQNQPLLIVCEDLHLVDPASRTALLSLARRITPAPILMIMTTRGGDDGAAGAGPGGSVRVTSGDDIRRLVLPPLGAMEANAVLDARSDRPAGSARRTLLDLAGGNPLALVELSTADVVAPTGEGLTLTRRLERAFAGRYSDLPVEPRHLVLAASLIGGESTPEALAAVAHVLGRDARAEWLTAAVNAGLVEPAGATRLRFRHPLVRSAVLSVSDPAERTMITRALVDTVEDTERTLQWRAELAITADPSLADELDRRASLGAAAGDWARAALALRRSADLSADSRLRADRLVRAADAARRAGAHEAAADLIGRAESQSDDAGLRAKASWIRELLPTDQSARAHGDFRPALDAIDRLRRTGQADEAISGLLLLASSVWDHATDTHPADQLATAVRRFDLDAGDPRLLLLQAVIDPAAHAESTLERARSVRDVASWDPESAWCLGYALNLSGDVADAARFLRRAVSGLRDQGNTALLPHALMGLAWICHLLGRLAEGRALIDECRVIAADLNDPGLEMAARLGGTWFDAATGVAPDAEAIAAAFRQARNSSGAPRDLWATATLARGMAALVSGRPGEALPAFLRIADAHEPADKLMFRVVSLPDLVEAAVATGDAALASAQVDEVSALTRGWRAASIEGALGCARILLADPSTLDKVASELSSHPLPVPLFDARAQLSVGVRLRRIRRPSAARAHLHRALEAFEQFPAPLWAQRCREELRASGERLADAQPSGRHVLTPQELRIGSLAASGLTNREIAERLFLSRRTVDAHLHSAFGKLGLTSRAQLADALGASGSRQPSGAGSAV